MYQSPTHLWQSSQRRSPPASMPSRRRPVEGEPLADLGESHALEQLCAAAARNPGLESPTSATHVLLTSRRHPRKASVSELDHGFFFEILASYFKNHNNYLKRTKTISAAPLNTLKIPKHH